MSFLIYSNYRVYPAPTQCLKISSINFKILKTNWRSNPFVSGCKLHPRKENSISRFKLNKFIHLATGTPFCHSSYPRLLLRHYSIYTLSRCMSRSIAIKRFFFCDNNNKKRHVSPVITPFSEIHFVWDGVPPVLSFLRGPQLIFFTPELILNYCAYAEGTTSSPKRIRKHRGIAKLFRPSKLAHLSYLFDRGFEKGLENLSYP